MKDAKHNRTIVYVDGENFIHRVMDLMRADLKGGRNDLVAIQLRSLIEHIIDADKNVEIRYYTTKLRLSGVPEEGREKLKTISEFNSQLLPRLANQGIKVIRAGILRSRAYAPCSNCGQITPYFVEKGVDVRLSVDMVEAAHRTDIARIALLSSDLDILPAIQAVRTLGTPVDYITSSKSVNRAMTASVDETFTFTKHDIINALKVHR